MHNKKVTHKRENRMVRLYRFRDKKAKLSICDFDDIWLMENITTKPCVYCGAVDKVGCDRIDNSKGHTKDNVVPCCKRCNLIRNQFFTHEGFKQIVHFCQENNIEPFSKSLKQLWCG